MVEKNIVWQKTKINRKDRTNLLGHNNKVLWLTGLSGAGKSTIAIEIEKELHKKGILSYLLDGDNIRRGLNQDLGFSAQDRDENIRRISEVAKLLYDAGIFVIVSFISPYKKVRENARQLIGDDFIEIFVNCPLEECEKRDTKGLYKKARQGELKNFTGVSDPYEKPTYPEIKIDTHKISAEESVQKILEYLEQK